ncbi:MAG TPA: nuclear transport factor 2 family protein [Deltaproteobacteria bacterium]|jgi:ketosteroid isomerase-like protein|nr:nuclear transport factor 2 family protein [Deltaproteobacteria bacterium]HQH99887.1 nuclear transport factor 2 family protein [Deltaproteobacteria bacterium]
MDLTNVSRDDKIWKDHLRARKLTNIWKFYDHFKKEEPLPYDEIFTDYAVWIMNSRWTDKVPFAGTYQGKEQITKLFDDYFKALEIIKFDHEYEIVDGSEVVVHFNLVAKVVATNKIFDMEFFDHFRVDERAKIIFCRRYYDTFTFTLPFKKEGPSHIVDVKTNPKNHKINFNVDYDPARLVWQIYEDFYEGRLESAKAACHPNFEVSYKGPGLKTEYALVPYPGKYYGMSGMDEFMINLGMTATMNDIDRYFLVEGNCVEIIFYEDWSVIKNGNKYIVYTINTWLFDENGKAIEMMCSPDLYEIAKAYHPEFDL